MAEIVGFATLTETGSIAEPSSAAMQRCMALALADAGVEAGSIDYVNAHATATEKGDIAEAQALLGLFGEHIPVSSLKGHLGHTLAASGGLETIATIAMMRRAELIPTRNLAEIDPRCQGPQIFTDSKRQTISLALKNNFALGGVNSSLVIRSIN